MRSRDAALLPAETDGCGRCKGFGLTVERREGVTYPYNCSRCKPGLDLRELFRLHRTYRDEIAVTVVC